MIQNTGINAKRKKVLEVKKKKSMVKILIMKKKNI